MLFINIIFCFMHKALFSVMMLLEIIFVLYVDLKTSLSFKQLFFKFLCAKIFLKCSSISVLHIWFPDTYNLYFCFLLNTIFFFSFNPMTMYGIHRQRLRKKWWDNTQTFPHVSWPENNIGKGWAEPREFMLINPSEIYENTFTWLTYLAWISLQYIL